MQIDSLAKANTKLLPELSLQTNVDYKHIYDRLLPIKNSLLKFCKKNSYSDQNFRDFSRSYLEKMNSHDSILKTSKIMGQLK